MKYRSIAIFAGILLPLTIQANTYQASMERLSPENPEFLFHVDLEKDFSLLGDFLTEAYLAYQTASPTASPVPVNYEQLFARLGLTNLRSATFTSERSGDSDFFNQGMFLFAGAPGGAFLLMGDSNEPFTVLSSVPADAAFFAESGLSGPALLGIIRNIAVDMMGPMGQGLIDAQLLQPITPDGLTAQDIINRLDTRVHIAIKPDAVPDSKSLPAMAMLNGKFAIRIMGIGDLLDSLAPILQGTGFIPLQDRRYLAITILPSTFTPIFSSTS